MVADLAELLSLCAQLRAERAGGAAVPDGLVWAATVALLGRDDGRLDAARAALREQRDPAPLAQLAQLETNAPALAEALERHAERVT